MSNLKCPFCQQELKIAGEHTTIMSCFNGDCKGSGLYGEKELWQGVKKDKTRTKGQVMNLWKIIPHRHIYRLGDYGGKRCRRCGRFRKLEQKD